MYQSLSSTVHARSACAQIDRYVAGVNWWWAEVGAAADVAC
ncbi:MAG: hypothetical protein QOF87_3565, partial [Pseudonocardiales bacterium]|nr:hypothetical protein [Pseudonocardiales bacterium]